MTGHTQHGDNVWIGGTVHDGPECPDRLDVAPIEACEPEYICGCRPWELTGEHIDAVIATSRDVESFIEIEWRRPDGTVLLHLITNTAHLDPRPHFPEIAQYIDLTERVTGAYTVHTRSAGGDWRKIATRHADGTGTWVNTWVADLLKAPEPEPLPPEAFRAVGTTAFGWPAVIVKPSDSLVIALPDDIPADLADHLGGEFRRWLDWRGLQSVEFTIVAGTITKIERPEPEPEPEPEPVAQRFWDAVPPEPEPMTIPGHSPPVETLDQDGDIVPGMTATHGRIVVRRRHNVLASAVILGLAWMAIIAGVVWRLVS